LTLITGLHFIQRAAIPIACIAFNASYLPPKNRSSRNRL
jgi:hypothetical protein